MRGADDLAIYWPKNYQIAEWRVLKVSEFGEKKLFPVVLHEPVLFIYPKLCPLLQDGFDT